MFANVARSVIIYLSIVITVVHVIWSRNGYFSPKKVYKIIAFAKVY